MWKPAWADNSTCDLFWKCLGGFRNICCCRSIFECSSNCHWLWTCSSSLFPIPTNGIHVEYFTWYYTRIFQFALEISNKTNCHTNNQKLVICSIEILPIAILKQYFRSLSQAFFIIKHKLHFALDIIPFFVVWSGNRLHKILWRFVRAFIINNIDEEIFFALFIARTNLNIWPLNEIFQKALKDEIYLVGVCPTRQKVKMLNFPWFCVSNNFWLSSGIFVTWENRDT